VLTHADMAQPSPEPSTNASATVVSPLDTPPPQAPSKQIQLSDFEAIKAEGWYTKY